MFKNTVHPCKYSDPGLASLDRDAETAGASWRLIIANQDIHGRIAGARGGFIPAEALVENGTAGNNGTAGRTLNQPDL